MNVEKLKPKDLIDIIFRIDEYLDYMRGNIHDASALINLLESYIKDYFQTIPTGELELKELTVTIVDELYKKVTQLTSRDINTDGYFAIIINRLFVELANKDVLCFFIIDNSVRDDRFKLVVELFNIIHFKSIFPYVTDKLEYSENYTIFPAKEFKEVKAEIKNAIIQNRHILYIEKDDRVNYLKNVLLIAEEIQGEYLCVFKNQSPESDEPVTWLRGSFKNVLSY